MGFLNPLFLLGILSAAVPLIIHLWSRRQARTVEFSALRFLLEAHRRTVRRFQLEQWLILALRAAALVFLALAMARPLLQRGGFLASARARTACVVVLDNSASMGYEGVRGVLFERAKSHALDVVNSLQSGDEASLVLLSDKAEVAFQPCTTVLADVRQAVESASLSARNTQVEAAMSAAVNLLETASAPNKELYVISDFSRNGWRAGRFESGGIRIFFLPVREEEPVNVAATGIRLLNPLAAVNVPVAFSVTLRNFGRSPARERTLEISVDGEIRRTLAIEIPPNGETQERFTHTFESPGTHTVLVRLNADRLPADDSRSMVLSTLGQLNAFVVGDDPLYLSLALNPTLLESPQATYAVRPTTLSYGAFAQAPLENADVLLLQEPNLADSRLTGRIRSFLLNGGACLLFLGNRTPPSSLAALDWLPVTSSGVKTFGTPVKLLPLAQDTTKSGGASPVAVAASRTVFDVFEEGQWSRPSAPNFYKAHGLALRGEGQLLASFTDGTPAMVAAPVESGRLVLINTPASGREWSNLPLTPTFVPLIQQLLFFAETPESPPQRNLEVGNPYARSLAPTDPLTLTIHTPTDEVRAVARSADGASVSFEETETPGVYRVGSEPGKSDGRGAFSDAFAVNLSTAESDLTPASREEVAASVQGTFEWLTPHPSLPQEGEGRVGDTEFGAELQAQRLGHEFWAELVIAALALLVAESVISNRTKRDDDGKPLAVGSSQ